MRWDFVSEVSSCHSFFALKNLNVVVLYIKMGRPLYGDVFGVEEATNERERGGDESKERWGELLEDGAYYFIMRCTLLRV